MKLTKVKKLRIGQMVCVVAYALGVAVYSAAGELKAYDDGYKKGADDLKKAYELRDDVVRFVDAKEDK